MTLRAANKRVASLRQGTLIQTVQAVRQGGATQQQFCVSSAKPLAQTGRHQAGPRPAPHHGGWRSNAHHQTRRFQP